jgi:hypothetical protein
MSYAAILYDDENYGGTQWPLNYAYIAQLSSAGIPNDAISSIKVAPFTTVILYSDSSFGGTSKIIHGPANIPKLGDFSDSGGNWDDRTSSLKVLRTLPTPTELITCCSGSAAGSTGSTCGQYVAGSSACTSAMLGYCVGVDALGAAVGPNHLDQPPCQSWCKQNPTLCDTAVLSYCRGAGSSTPFCSCINSPATTRGLINPKCVDATCIEQGYLTANMMQSNCPNVVNCSIKTDLTNYGVSLAPYVPVEQNCGGDAIVNNTTNSGASSGVNSGAGSGFMNFLTPPTSLGALMVSPIYLFLLFVVIVGICVVGYYVVGGSSTKKYDRFKPT